MRSQCPESLPTSETRGGEADPTDPYIPRRLRGRIRDEDVLIADDHVLDLEGPIVVLGEPGMGKTTLMERLAEWADTSLVDAQTLIRWCACGAGERLSRKRLVIDALDEMPAAREGDAVDAVLSNLGLLGYPPFILSCRVADWRSATAVSKIKFDYGRAPMELFLEPFSRQKAETFLSRRFRADEARRLVEHLTAMGLGEMLGNPQNLAMIQAVGPQGELPTTRGELYDKATERLRCEHQPKKAGERLADLDDETALNAAGAAFAVLLLTGREVISRIPSGSEGEGAIHVGDVRRLPGGDAIGDVLGSRLFRAGGPERFAPLHRTIAEHLGARWLARVASTPRQQRRLLALIQFDGLVPTSLRGLHAWLARAPEMAEAVERMITADLLGVVLYGDADQLGLNPTRSLLKELRSRCRGNRDAQAWDRIPFMDALFQQGLLRDIQELIENKHEGVELRHLLLRGLRDQGAGEALRETLLVLVRDPEEVFVVRHGAVEALVRSGVRGIEWTDIAAELIGYGGRDDLRLTIDLMRVVGPATFSDDEIVQYVLRSAHDTSRGRVLGTLVALAWAIPPERALSILRRLSNQEQTGRSPRDGASDFRAFVRRLIEAWLRHGPVDPVILWSCLRLIAPIGPDHDWREGAIADWLRENDDARRRIQRHVLLGEGGAADRLRADDVRGRGEGYVLPRLPHTEGRRMARARKMARVCPALHPSEDDAIALLRAAGAPPEDEAGLAEWIDLLRIANRGQGPGPRVMAVAREMSAGSPAAEAALRAFDASRSSEQEIEEDRGFEDDEWLKERAAEEEHLASRRAAFLERLDELRDGGDIEQLSELAQGYLGVEAYLGFPLHVRPKEPHRHLIEWVGPEVAEAALAGFEAFLVGPNCPSPAAIEMAQSEGKMLLAEPVVAAAFAARGLEGQSLDDLSNERLLAGGMAARFSPMLDEGLDREEDVDHNDPLDLAAFVEAEIRRRPGLMERHLRIAFEPDLRRAGSHSHDLYGVMNRDEDAGVAGALAEEWLARFEVLDDRVEWYLVDRLVRTRRIKALLSAAAARRIRGWRTDQERLRWTAVEEVMGEGGASGRSAMPPDLTCSGPCGGCCAVTVLREGPTPISCLGRWLGWCGCSGALGRTSTARRAARRVIPIRGTPLISSRT